MKSNKDYPFADLVFNPEKDLQDHRVIASLHAWNDEHFYECSGCGNRGNDERIDSADESVCDCRKLSRPVRKRVLCDLDFDAFAPSTSVALLAAFLTLVKKTTNIDWLVFTRHISSVANNLDDACELMDMGMGVFAPSIYPNLWMGVVVSSQLQADRDVPALLDLPLAKRMAYVEGPMELVDLPCMVYYGTESSGGIVPLKDKGYAQLDWVICDGRLVRSKNPTNPDYVRKLRDDCVLAKTRFYFIGFGNWRHTGKDPNNMQMHILRHGKLNTRCFAYPNGDSFIHVDKSEDGFLLDDATHTETI